MARYLVIVLVIATLANADKLQEKKNSTAAINLGRCTVPQKAPKNIEKVIGECQDEIKYAILTEALESLNAKDLSDDVKSRKKRSYFNDDEKRIAGCLLHCVFRRKNALNEAGFPTLEGLVNLYAEGVTEKAYVLATIQAVHICLSNAKSKHFELKNMKENGKSCDVAYEVFDCVSDKIAEFCGQTP